MNSIAFNIKSSTFFTLLFCFLFGQMGWTQNEKIASIEYDSRESLTFLLKTRPVMVCLVERSMLSYMEMIGKAWILPFFRKENPLLCATC